MPEDSPEVREAINSTLRDILSTEGWGQSQWDALLKYLHKEFDIETDLLELEAVGFPVEYEERPSSPSEHFVALIVGFKP